MIDFVIDFTTGFVIIVIHFKQSFAQRAFFYVYYVFNVFNVFYVLVCFKTCFMFYVLCLIYI